MTLPTRWPQRAIAILLIVAAGLFVLGVTAESNDSHSDEPAAETVEHNESPERVLGINVESRDLVTTAVVVSLLLAALVWRRPTRPLLMLIAVAAAAFAVLDAAEVAHQLHENRTRLALLAGLVAAVHAAAAALAIHQTTTVATVREPAGS